MIDLGRVGSRARRDRRAAVTRRLQPGRAWCAVAGLAPSEGMAPEARVAIYAGTPPSRRPRRRSSDDPHGRGALHRGQSPQASRIPRGWRLQGLHQGARLTLPRAQRAAASDDGSVVLLPWRGSSGRRGRAQPRSGAWSRGPRAAREQSSFVRHGNDRFTCVLACV